LIISLEVKALKHAVSQKHLRANGLLLLRELVKTYKPINVPEVIAAKTVEFWGHTKRLPTETIDQYYDRFHELLDDLQDADEPVTTKSAIRQFIFTLGSEFESIQNNFRVKVLPSEWYSEDWPTILTLCRDYYNSVKPHSLLRCENTGEQNGDRAAYQKKIRDWWLKPSKFSKLIETEQQKHPGKCLYHLTKSHPTSACAVKRECDRIVAANSSGSSNPSSSSTSTSVGQLRHITEESFEDATDEVVDDAVVDDTTNDTSDEVLHYFARVTNHYLRLVKSNTSLISRHNMDYPIIADSGANCHMFKEIEFFDSLVPTTGKVILGDGKASLTIQGIGTVKMKLDGHELYIENVRYVPDLAESIYSLLLHIKCPNHGLQSSFDEGLKIIFPAFTTSAILGKDDIYLDAVPCRSEWKFLSNVQSSPTAISNSVCRHTSQLEQDIRVESAKVDSFLNELRRYYQAVKTKRQLNMEVPAGFRRENAIQSNFRHNANAMLASTQTPNQCPSALVSFENSSPVINDIDTTDPSITPPPTSQVPRPILRCVDKPSSSLPSRLTFT
jgi:hypothetical protein